MQKEREDGNTKKMNISVTKIAFQVKQNDFSQLEWPVRIRRFPVQIPLGALLGLVSQPRSKVPGVLRVKIAETQ